MAKWCQRVVALSCALALSAVSSSGDQTVVTFAKRGTVIGLTAEEQSQVAERVRAVIVGCAITSVASPSFFAGRPLAEQWTDVRAHSHLYVRFAEPIQTERSGVRFTEVAIGFDLPNLAGPELSRYGDEVVGYVKCSGHRLLALMCSPALRKHLAAGQERSCTVYDRVGEPH
jgi:hypothetical protein